MQNRILIVDDDELVLSAMKDFLTDEQYTVETISRADRVNNMIVQFDPQLIILDIRLESADGRVICDKLKSHKNTAHIYIILLTALSYDEIAVFDCLADAIIGKPYEGSSLASTIEQLLSNG